MRSPEEGLISIMRRTGIDFTSSLPCEKIKVLLDMIEAEYAAAPLRHLPLTREEEGVGVSAGAALAGRRPAIFVQSSGIGNMINALLSLTGFYRLPLAIFVSQRGVYQEKIEAQKPMGLRLPRLLEGAGIPHSVISSQADFPLIENRLAALYKKGRMHAFLLSPAIWGKPDKRIHKTEAGEARRVVRMKDSQLVMRRVSRPTFTRFQTLEIAAPYLESKAVVCNLGFPSKELYHIMPQPSNFYMLGSMGMVTPIGLGISLSTRKEVVVIEGDGSILMNPGTLATAACVAPHNLTILAIDNASYGSTGNQPTLTGSCVNLELVAKGFGIRDTVTVSTKRELLEALATDGRFRFIHILSTPGNRDLPNIPLDHLEIKKQVQDFLKAG